MNVSHYITDSEEATISLGRELGRALPQCCVVLLIGNLGAGKTTLAKGILSGMGLATEDEVTSPTFTLIHEYQSPERRAYHIDLYRLDRAEQIATLGLDEIFERQAVVLIEWGERFPQLMPAERMEIRLQPSGEDSRKEDSRKEDSRKEDSRKIEVRRLSRT